MAVIRSEVCGIAEGGRVDHVSGVADGGRFR